MISNEKIAKEIDRLDKMPPMAAEAVVVRTYVDWLLSNPLDLHDGGSSGYYLGPKDSRGGPFRIREGQRADPGVSGSARPGGENERADPVFSRTTRCGQNILGKIYCPCIGTQVCPDIVGWSSG